MLAAHIITFKRAEFINMESSQFNDDYYNAVCATVTHGTKGIKLKKPFKVIFFLNDSEGFTLKANTSEAGWLAEGHQDELTLHGDPSTWLVNDLAETKSES